MQRVTRLITAALATLTVAGCSDFESRTDLNAEGPPMVRQVRMWEKYLDTIGVERGRRVFAFGTHEQAEDIELAVNRPTGMVTAADAMAPTRGIPVMPDDPSNASIYGFRVIMDELLVGNNLEEVACRGNVDGDFLARVPIGATPEDIARCSGPDDVLPKTCPASNRKSTCICQLDSGCSVGTKVVEKGMPVGISDLDQDGAADETRMINGAIKIKCGPGGMIDVPLNLDFSYWNPSGDQNVPALGGFDALGPALVLTPSGPLPTNVECVLAFADGSDPNLPAIVDKQGERVCAPTEGKIENGCPAPGDTSAFKFRVEPLVIKPLSISDGATNVNRNIAMGGVPLDFVANVPLNPGSLATNVTISPAVPGATITLIGTGLNAVTIRISGPAGTQLAANTMYRVTITTSVTDTHNQPLPQQVVVTFTTGA